VRVSLYYQDATLTLLLGDAVEQLRTLPDSSVDCVVTSPPYFGRRDYEGHPEQLGLEETPAEYVAALAGVFAEVHRVLADDGTLWLNLGDSYSSKPGPQEDQNIHARWDGAADRKRGALGGDRIASTKNPGLPSKNLLGIPWRVAFALQDAGWYLRNAIVWHKPNAMPESVQDRLSNRYEFLFLLTKSRRYYFDLDAIREPLAHPDALDRGIVFGGANAGEGKVGGSARRGGGHRSVYGAPTQTSAAAHRFGPNDASTLKQALSKGRNPGDVWSIPTTPLPEAHFAAFPPELPRRCIKAGCRPGGTVLDPFSGAGTTAMAAQQLGRKAIGIDLVAAYHDIALRRMSDAPLPFGEDCA
jgi:DNA modification methylase